MGVAAGDLKAAAGCCRVPEDPVLPSANSLLLCCSSGEKGSVSSAVVLEFCAAGGLQLLFHKPARRARQATDFLMTFFGSLVTPSVTGFSVAVFLKYQC